MKSEVLSVKEKIGYGFGDMSSSMFPQPHYFR